MNQIQKNIQYAFFHQAATTCNFCVEGFIDRVERFGNWLTTFPHLIPKILYQYCIRNSFRRGSVNPLHDQIGPESNGCLRLNKWMTIFFKIIPNCTEKQLDLKNLSQFIKIIADIYSTIYSPRPGIIRRNYIMLGTN